MPQGSFLGPKLFILYINDIVNVSKLLNCILFADDNTIFYSGKNKEQMLSVVKQEFEKIRIWLKINIH